MIGQSWRQISIENHPNGFLTKIIILNDCHGYLKLQITDRHGKTDSHNRRSTLSLIYDLADDNRQANSEQYGYACIDNLQIS